MKALYLVEHCDLSPPPPPPLPRLTDLRKPLQKEPSDLALALGDIAAFQCIVDARPLPMVTWYKGNTRVVQGQGQGVTIYPTDPKLRGAPQFVVRPRPQWVVEGEAVYLHCVAFGRDAQGKPPIVSWLKDGRTLSVGQDGRLEIGGAGTLVIQSVRESDAGVYTCRAVNLDDTADADAALTVLVRPMIIDRPSNMAALTGTDVTLACKAKGVPEPDITWYKDGLPIMLGHYHKLLSGGDLQILGVMAVDAGMYQCLAGNDLSDTQASASLMVYDGDLTRYGRRPGSKLISYALSVEPVNSESRQRPASPHNLRPVQVSTRSVTVAWELQEKAGREDRQGLVFSVFWREVGSERERVSNTSTLEFQMQRLRPRTEYEVRVRSYNSQGPSEREATARVTTKPEVLVPSTPLRLEATPVSSTEIVVRWAPPLEPNGRILAYYLYYHKKRRLDKTSLKLKALEEFSQYSFRVAAVNSKGEGMKTNEVTARTFSDEPSEPPQNFTLEVSSSSSLTVRWQPPPLAAQNGIITGYKIRRRRKGDKQGGETFTTAGDRNTYALKDLRRGTEYQVRVAAMTANGTGPNTHWASAATFREDLDESRAPDQPAGLTTIAKATSIDVSWIPPLPSSNILVRGYILGYGLRIPDVFRIDFGPEVRHHKIENLSPNNLYVISIQAVNQRGPSPQKLTSVTTLKKDDASLHPISPPVGLTATVQSSTAVRLTWADSTLSGNEPITDHRFYTVHYKSQSSRRGKWRAVNATDLSHVVKGLRPYTEYEFQVTVTNGHRTSDFSMSVLATTEERAPSTEPRDVTPVPLQDNPLAVSLNWQPPARPNGLITDYLIYYTTHLHTEDIVWPGEDVDGESLSTVIENLTPDTTYFFIVQARNSKGVSPRSIPVQYVTPPACDTVGSKEPSVAGAFPTTMALA
ncbi:neogenin [Plakobranchus ocellatus]|uniref:Neogenin n=1 Tax=Plakobranchus ocellatus TaxID=259542 RepID=A0AAV4C1S1_9GAST|nr:neogenin [Plakobranchus ocellatus]